MTTSTGCEPSAAALRPRRAASAALSPTRKATSIAGEVFSSYSTSASASDGLHALVEVAVGDDAAEGAQLLRFVTRRHGEIGVVPVTENAESLEVGALQCDLLTRVRAAGGAKGLRVELAARSAVRLLDLQLDRQAVTIPPGDVG
jgi:hypothetical protein